LSGGERDRITGNLGRYLAERLPFYMLPASIKVLDGMPLTPNGKIDRLALPHLESIAGEDRYIAPGNDTEKRLVSIWKEILGVERIGIRDNFFELGGHSLLAVRLFSRIQEEFGQSLPLLLLFKEGTVEAIAQSLTSKENSTIPQGIVPIRPEGSEPPLFIVSAGLYMRELVLGLAPVWPVYGVDPFEDGKVVYRKSVQETAKIFYRNLVDFYPQGPYSLLAHSAYGYFALELARLLVQSGKEVNFLGLLDTYPPGPRRQATLVDRVKIHILNLQKKNFPYVLQYFGSAVRRFLTRWRRRAVVDAGWIEYYEKKGQVKEIRNLLLRAYHPEPYLGQVTLFTATHRPWYMRWDPMEDWANILTGKLEVVPIPGDHMSALTSPHLDMLARKIESLLRRHDND
jgi:thioesterase domain-containing protein/acyl carrier protein